MLGDKSKQEQDIEVKQINYDPIMQRDQGLIWEVILLQFAKSCLDFSHSRVG